MAAKRHKADEIVTKLRQVNLLNARGKSPPQAALCLCGMAGEPFRLRHYRFRR